jgi:DNA-binding transcriptional ArsR family regulator
MLAIRFGLADVAAVRFAISPLIEVVRSVRVLDDPAGNALHLPWITRTRELVADLDLSVIRALQPPDVDTPDFIHPPPSSPLAELEDDLAVMIATPVEQVRSELQIAYRRGPLPPVLGSFIDEPEAALVALAGLVRTYWERALAPDWPRLRALLEGDVLYRARQIADGGAQRLFSDLHPGARFDGDALLVEKRYDETLSLDGRGLLFVPSAFVWPKLLVIAKRPWQPTLLYPARGIGTLWDPDRPAARAALGALLGARRADVLSALDAPRSTTEVARALGVSAASASQHLTVLRDAGLVNAHRVGRSVLYARSPAGESLAGDERPTD